MGRNDQKEGVSRRDVLKSTGVAGAGIGLLPAISRATTEDKTRIPVVVSGDEVVLTRKVPRRWWKYIKKVRSVRERLGLHYTNNPAVVDVNITLSEKNVAGRLVTKVNLDLSQNAVKESFPETVDGVEVDTSRSKKAHTTGCTNVDTFSNMPGGVAVDDDSSGWALTSFCRVYSSSSEKYLMMSAGHGWGSCDNTPDIGDPLYQYGQYAGACDSYSMTYDIIMFEDDSIGVDYSNDVMTSSGRWPIDGAATNYEYMQSEYTTTHKSGVASGYTSGYIKKSYVTANHSCHDLNGHGIQVSNDQHGGDSGAPVYVKFDNDTVGIVSIATLGVDQYDESDCNGANVYYDALGTSSEKMNDMGLQFGK